MNREQATGQSSKPTRGLTWRRVLAMLVCELSVLQPSLAFAQLAQVPLFTVTSIPPNVLLMFDDSASMQLLSLNPPASYANPTATRSHSGNPLVKVNTQGYFGISGIKWYTGAGVTDNNKWSFIRSEILQRSAAFNPLAYNPAVQYLPWNDNGTRMPNADYGGSTNVAVGPLTPWDPRNFPSYMKFTAAKVPVSSKLPTTSPRSGVIPAAGALRSWAADAQVKAGSVRYHGLIANAGDASGADLFTSTIVWDNPNCAAPSSSDTYGWTCPAGTAFASPADPNCSSAAQVGTFSATRTCCTDFGSTPATRVATRDIWFNASYPPGTPPPMNGTAGEVCTSITNINSRMVNKIPLNCTTTDDPPYVAPCGGGGGELCVFDPAPVTTCEQVPEYLWRCTFIQDYMQTTCNVAPIAQQCVVTGSTPTCPGGNAPLTTSSDARYVSGYWTPARYAVYDGPPSGTPAERNDLNNYRMIMVDRKFGWNGGTGTRDLIGTNLADAVSKWFVVDGVTGVVGYRPDCDVLATQDGTWCTFEQEAQNYANWFTYYRSRLFAKIGTVSEVLSSLTGPEQFMRLGYGRINYFKGALNPWNVNSITDIPNPMALPTLDSVTNEGALERGVRPFTVFDPPLSATPNPDRQAVFDWLFTINGLGPTPNREAMHAVGQYLTRTDSEGPWGEFPGSGSEPQSDHLWCRRNFSVLGTDGEWTKLDPIGGFVPQRLLERASDWSADPASLGVTTSMSVNGPVISEEPLDPLIPSQNYQYVVASEPQITGGSGSTQSGTLTDVLHYYWSRDLRPDLRDSLRWSPTGNRAYWQHMATYVVGYGVVASMESPTIRTEFQSRNAIAWPTVGLESCRQLDDNAADTALGPPACTAAQHTVTPSGNRINDTLRAGLASSGDFYSANSPASLRNSLASVFEDLTKEASAGTSVGISNTTIAAGELLVQSGFFTNTWEGTVQAVDAKAQLDFLNGVGPQPPTVWTVNFPVPGSRNIVTSTAQNTGADFAWCGMTGLSAAQRTSIDPVFPGACPAVPDIMNYLRGDQSQERRFGGVFRDRRGTTVLGDIVNSSPLHSHAADHAYHLAPAASYSSSGTNGFTEYRGAGKYLETKRTSRWPTVIFGANDGMLHILDARVGQATSGQEIFAYVPRAVYPRLRNLADPAYTHKYTVDGPVVEGDVWNGSVWKTIIVGSTGAGPAGLFAIDVTAPQSGLSRSNVLWDITPADHLSSDVQKHLGSTIGAGVIGSVRHDIDSSLATQPNGEWAFVVGNGYESANHTAALLVFNAFTGDLIRAIDTKAGSPATPNGLGAITPVYDGSRNIVAVYAGDKLGNLWKFDLSDADPANWKSFIGTVGSPQPLFAAGSNRPILQAPRILPHPLGGLFVTFGTGKYFEVGDPGDTSDQGIFAIWDKAQTATIPFGSVEPLLLEEFVSAGETFRRLRAAELANYTKADSGFWIRLRPVSGTPNGERIIAPLLLDAGFLVATSFAPESGTDRCIPGGSSFLYRLDLSGGFERGAFGTLGGVTIGRKTFTGVFGGMSPVYEAVNHGATVNHSMTAADVKTMLSSPKYRVSSTGQATEQGATGTCTHVGLHVTGSWARIPTNCAGMLPLRAWRPLR